MITDELGKPVGPCTDGPWEIYENIFGYDIVTRYQGEILTGVARDVEPHNANSIVQVPEMITQLTKSRAVLLVVRDVFESKGLSGTSIDCQVQHRIEFIEKCLTKAGVNYV